MSSASDSLRIKFIQLNMNNCDDCGSFLNVNYLNEKNILMLVQEPQKSGCKVNRFPSFSYSLSAKNLSINPRAAIIVNNQDFGVCSLDHLSSRDLAVCEIVRGDLSMIVASVYCDKKRPIRETIDQLERIKTIYPSRPLLIAGDFNAWNQAWFSAENCARGVELCEWLNASQLCFLNDSPRPTYECTTGSSHIDLAICNSKALRMISNYKLSDEINFSDHHTISFDLLTNAAPTQRDSTRIFNSKAASPNDWNNFKQALLNDFDRLAASCSSITNADQINVFANELTAAIQNACDGSLKKIKARPKNNTWWSPAIAKLRKESNRRRKLYQRCKNTTQRARLKQNYIEQLGIYRAAISSSKQASAAKILDQVRGDLWKVYALSKRKPNSPLSTVNTGSGEYTNCTLETMNHLLSKFFPANCTQIERRASWSNPDTPLFTATELEKAAARLSNRKSPGPDHIDAEILKHCLEVYFDLILMFFNKCLVLGTFPDRYKTGSLCLIPKLTTADTYKMFRPIVLLSLLGKLLERLFALRLSSYLYSNSLLSQDQYGFREGLSTVDALMALKQRLSGVLENGSSCVVVSLDIAAAFDNVNHNLILNQLNKKNVPRNLIDIISSFLSNRTIKFKKNGLEATRATECGTPQGAVCSPILFSLAFDDLLSSERLLSISKTAFADDLNLTFYKHQFEIINQTLQSIWDWGAACGLRFNPSKTKAMLVSRKANEIGPPIQMNGIDIPYSESIPFVGVIFDPKLTFKSHLEQVGGRVRVAHGAVKRLIGLNCGLRPEQLRQLYMATVQSVIAYAAPVWIESLDKTQNSTALLRLQRQLLRPIIRATHGLSNSSLYVLTGIMPITIYLRHLARFYRLKKDGLFRVLGRPADLPHFKNLSYQWAVEDWNRDFAVNPDSAFALFVKSINNDSIKLFKRGLNHSAIQFVTGHGRFGGWMHRTGRGSPDCRDCGAAADGPAHVLLECPVWREEALRRLGDFDASNLTTLVSAEKAEDFNDFCKVVIEARRAAYPI